MKKNKSFLMLLSATMGVISLTSLIGAFMLRSTEEKKGAGSVLILICVVSILLLLLEAFIFRNQTAKYTTKLASQLIRTQRDSMLHFPAPCVILDSDETIMWYNRLFEKQVYSEDSYGDHLENIMNIDLERAFEEDGCQICVNKRYYIAKAVRTDLKNGLSMVYFKDITDYTELRYDAYQSHNSVIIIVIDNYDAMMSDIRDTEKAHVAVEIEKLMESFLEGPLPKRYRTTGSMFSWRRDIFQER